MDKKQENNLKIVLVFGGRSPEHEVSVLSARSIYKSLNKDKYTIALVGIAKQGGFRSLTPAELQDIESVRADSGVDFNVQQFKQFDLAFPIVHGTTGEDGSLQGFFEILGLKYVGGKVLGSAICMDKDISKRLLSYAGFNVAKWLTIHQDSEVNYTDIIGKLGTNLFVKPANNGSSIGVSKANNEKELREAIKEAFKFDSKIIIEEAIEGREIEVGVIGSDDPVASASGEVSTTRVFYDYEAKYLNESVTKIMIPADLPNEKANELRSYAIRAYQTLECKGFARVDFFTTSSGQVIVNEVNTLPGFTQYSMFPRLFEASGLPYSSLLDKIIELSSKTL